MESGGPFAERPWDFRFLLAPAGRSVEATLPAACKAHWRSSRVPAEFCPPGAASIFGLQEIN